MENVHGAACNYHREKQEKYKPNPKTNRRFTMKYSQKEQLKIGEKIYSSELTKHEVFE